MGQKFTESYRLRSAETNDIPNINLLEPKLQVIDFRFGEDCNLRCRMCEPGSSNKLRIDYKYFANNKIDTTGIQYFDWTTNKSHDRNMRRNSHNEVHFWSNGEHLKSGLYTC